MLEKFRPQMKCRMKIGRPLASVQDQKTQSLMAGTVTAPAKPAFE
jgi:hypothetical protein